MKYIYESPDGGKTIYRHPFGFPNIRERLGDDDHVIIDGIVINLPEDIKEDRALLKRVDEFLNRKKEN